MMGALPPEPVMLTPVTSACVVSAANQYQVHPALLLAILGVERGALGGANANSNRTLDLGPMQINTVHLPALSPFGISAEKLKNDGCLNVHIGAYLLKSKESSLGGSQMGKNTWQAVAHYHSKTPDKGRVYAAKVAIAYAALPDVWKQFQCQQYNACQIKVQYQNGIQVAWHGLDGVGSRQDQMVALAYGQPGQNVGQQAYGQQDGGKVASVVLLAPYVPIRKNR
jgi:Transglycosylase SLT domain